jgi:hypothetical protein
MLLLFLEVAMHGRRHVPGPFSVFVIDLLFYVYMSNLINLLTLDTSMCSPSHVVHTVCAKAPRSHVQMFEHVHEKSADKNGYI